ncbi:MAG: diaminopimelate epimerase [Clostridiales bacterium]|nr:diaminopimelate epimerase [Clostridiales bacterium]HBM79831.1 diaminopimelate epimerase [Clostridiaceae bacterium]
MIFTKMQGTGNDFIVIEDFECKYKKYYSQMAKKLCDRHFGVGADGLLIASKCDDADAFMFIYNSDGSLAEMCGNGVRCFAKYIYDRHLTDKTTVKIGTLDGLKEVQLILENGNVAKAKVNMGTPRFETKNIPAVFNKNIILNEPVKIDSYSFNITSLSTGVPHTVIFVSSLPEDRYIKKIGPMVENYDIFPEKTNVNFVLVKNGNEFYMKTWERGAGLTLACGTGACASLAACVINEKTQNAAIAHVPGGDLFLEWDKSSNNIYMTGPALTVFKGDYFLNICPLFVD